MKIKVAETDAEILSVYPVLKELRPKLVLEELVSDVRRQEKQGFKLAYLADPEVLAVAGYRPMEMFVTGKILYVDDLVTASAQRSKGHGKALLDWLLAEARRLDCKYLELDSGLARLDAHRFYKRHGLEEVGLHFSIPVNGGQKWTSE
jgi:GNAT superfamily N-acetyltransferase